MHPFPVRSSVGWRFRCISNPTPGGRLAKSLSRRCVDASRLATCRRHGRASRGIRECGCAGYFRVRHVVDGLRALEGSNWLVTRFTVTNSDSRARVFFAPEQVGLIYLTPALEKTPKFPPSGRGCASGYCERNLEFGGDTHPVQGGDCALAIRVPDSRPCERLPAGSATGAQRAECRTYQLGLLLIWRVILMV
jgi:hypothetical protein